MKQTIPNSLSGLITAAEKVAAGAAKYETSLGLVVATKALLQSDINAVTGAEAIQLKAKTDLKEARKTLRAKTSEAYDVAFTIRDSLKRALGRQYSTEWAGTGFAGSLEVPRSVPGLEQLLRSLKSYLSGHPELEKADVATVTIASHALDDLVAAHKAATLQTGALRGFVAARKQKQKALRRRISWVVDELSRVLGPVDERWEAFGLNQPGLKEAPSAPEEVTLRVEEGTLEVNWEQTPRAERYRVWIKVKGVDEVPRLLETTRETGLTIPDVPNDAGVEVYVTAVNSGGESRPSRMAKLMIP